MKRNVLTMLVHCRNAVKRIFLNKYAVVLILFAFVFLFIGEQNVLLYIQRAYQKRQMRKELEQYKSSINYYRHEIERLEDIDSLEFFARENYLMKADNEVIYWVEE